MLESIPWRTLLPILFSFSKLPWSLLLPALPPPRPPLSFFLASGSPPHFSIPPTTLRGWKRIELFILRLNSTLTLRKNNPCNTLYYHISATFKQSLWAWTENYHPAGRHKPEGLRAWKRDAQQLAGAGLGCRKKPSSWLYALISHGKLGPPSPCTDRENNSNLLKCGRAGKQWLL